MTSEMKRVIFILGLASLLLGGYVANNMLTQMREVRTLANLQLLAANIEGDEERSVAKSFEAQVVRFFENGKDPWGQEIILHSNSDNPSSEYLLLSKGSDRAWDVAAPSEYLHLAPQTTASNRRGQDIVLKGRTPIRWGG